MYNDNISKVVYIALLVAIVVGASAWLSSARKAEAPEISTSVPNPRLIFNSSVFENGALMPARFTCDGANVNPPFEIGGVVPKARSLALVMDDPDAPVGVWDHWVKWNIPPKSQVIEEGKEPRGVSGKGTGGNLNYRGPCPPSGTHRYFFKLYVLDTVLALNEGATKKELATAMEGHILQTAEYIGRYSRVM